MLTSPENAAHVVKFKSFTVIHRPVDIVRQLVCNRTVWLSSHDDSNIPYRIYELVPGKWIPNENAYKTISHHNVDASETIQNVHCAAPNSMFLR
jgi:hypothetical protein